MIRSWIGQNSVRTEFWRIQLRQGESSYGRANPATVGPIQLRWGEFSYGSFPPASRVIANSASLQTPAVPFAKPA